MIKNESKYIDMVNQMINKIPNKFFEDPDMRFIDPFVTDGAFLLSVIGRLKKSLPYIKHNKDGLEYDLTSREGRVNYILKNMIYGISTSKSSGYTARKNIYGVSVATDNQNSGDLDSVNNYAGFFGAENTASVYDNSIFDDVDRRGYEEQGNIFYSDIEDLTHNADIHYPILHKTNHEIINKIKNKVLKFDVVIGSPPSVEYIPVNHKSFGDISFILYCDLVYLTTFELKPKIALFTISREFESKKHLFEETYYNKMESDWRSITIGWSEARCTSADELMAIDRFRKYNISNGIKNIEHHNFEFDDGSVGNFSYILWCKKRV